jgi:hypothetical protein
MDIEGRYLGSSLTVAYKSYRRGKKRRDKQGGDQAVRRLFSARYVTYVCLRLDVT